MDVKKAIGAQVKSKRLEKGMTLRETAAALGTSIGVLGYIENGNIPPSDEEKYLRFLGELITAEIERLD